MLIPITRGASPVVKLTLGPCHTALMAMSAIISGRLLGNKQLYIAQLGNIASHLPDSLTTLFLFLNIIMFQML